MGQKANTLTLRKDINNINLNYYKNNSKNTLYGLQFIKFLRNLLQKKKIFLTSSIVNFNENKIYVTLFLFFQSVLIKQYKKQLTYKNKKSIISKNLHFVAIWKKCLFLLKKNLVIIDFVNLNKYTNSKKKQFIFLYNKFKYIISKLFPRRFSFFIDFLKITSLFVNKKVSLSFYLKVVSFIFKILQKKRHTLFISFMEQFFQILINDKIFNKNLIGVKFVISGRIKAKPRAKSLYFQLGSTPTQTLNKETHFAYTHVYTIYGVFGFKMWVVFN